jgi:hypothetical protein
VQLIHPEPAQALLGLRAMKSVASAAGAIGPAQRALMEAAKQFVLRIDADIDALAPIAPADFAAGFPDSDLRRQFVNGMLVVALADGMPDPAVTATVETFAEAIGVATPELKHLRQLTEQDLLLFKLDFLRHGHIADIMRDQREQKGLLGLAKGVLGMRGVMEDKALAAKYGAWERLAPDTLGHALFRYYRRNGFGLPGEKGGFPEAGIYHDFSHVLADYDTDMPGEVEVASFTAGYKKRRPFYVMMFAILIFSTGINMRPTAGPTRTGILGDPGMAARMFTALERGGKVGIDLSDKWDYWPYVDLPIVEARRRLGIPEKIAT